MDATANLKNGSSWYENTIAAPAERSRLAFDLDVDVCVVGGGLAGLTVAREVARRGWSVAVLEAKRVAWSGSGRNCGIVRPGFAADIERIIERVGLDHAKALWKLSEQGCVYIRDAIADTGMPGVAPVDGWLGVSTSDDGDRALRMLTLMGQEFGAEVEGWSVERVRDVLKTNHYFHAVHVPTAFHIHSLNYAQGLAVGAEQAGARIFEQTAAIEIDPAGVRKRVVTPSARVRAAHVVLAGHGHLDGLAPRLAETLLPVISHVAVTAPLGARLAEAVTYRGAVGDSGLADRNYRIVSGDRLMWAGGASAWSHDPLKAAGRVKAEIARLYPQLGEVDIAHVWLGATAVAVHRMPQIGEVSPGVWLASAFGGHGLNTSAMAGDLIARAIVEGDDRWRLFLPYELVWAGGALGRVLAQVSHWSRKARESVAASAARRREALRRAKDMREEEAGGDGEDVAAGPR
jgi:gamma-glutamylputrescine oxidase